jgi:hypothetical protein
VENRRRTILWIGGIVLLIIIGVVGVMALLLGTVAVGYVSTVAGPEADVSRRPGRPVVYVTFAPPAAEGTPLSITTPATQTEAAAAETTASNSDATAVNGASSEPSPAANSTENGSPPPPTATKPAQGQPAGPTATTVSSLPTVTSGGSGQSSSPIPSPTPVAGAAAPTNTAAPTTTPPPTATPVPTKTPTPAPGGISGRLVVNGQPAGGVLLRLEDQSYNVLAETTTSSDGGYTFNDLPASDQGYNVLFSQDWNSQYANNQQIISWGWLGPVAVQDNNTISLPDFDIDVLGFDQRSPDASTSLSAGSPIQFEWNARTGAGSYWVDLANQQAVVWQSAPVEATTTSFNGQLEAGQYWWGVGAKSDLSGYTLTTYGYLQAVSVDP